MTTTSRFNEECPVCGGKELYTTVDATTGSCEALCMSCNFNIKGQPEFMDRACNRLRDARIHDQVIDICPSCGLIAYIVESEGICSDTGKHYPIGQCANCEQPEEK